MYSSTTDTWKTTSSFGNWDSFDFDLQKNTIYYMFIYGVDFNNAKNNMTGTWKIYTEEETTEYLKGVFS